MKNYGKVDVGSVVMICRYRQKLCYHVPAGCCIFADNVVCLYRGIVI